jgi:hypothetical protein
MRKLELRWGMLGALALALVAGSARADSVSFGDSTRYWAGYGNGTSDDGKDTIGHPDLKGGTATFQGGLLTQIRIDFAGPLSLVASGNGTVIPGDLFLDAGADGDWDFVMKLVAGPQTAVPSYATLRILDVQGQSPSYLKSGKDNTGHWKGFGIRDDHPYAWNGGGTQIGSGSLDPFSATGSGLQSLLFHLGNGLDLGGAVTIGFAVSCANDVLRETIARPTPEPTAALVFAAGLLVVARRQRRA